jgi:hypothetical protein
MIRMDGESWGTDPSAENKLQILKTPAFEGWEAWKKRNKEGLDCSIMIVRKENTVTISTANSGITTQNVTTISGDIPSLYVALTGDQCALTGIRIS